MTGLRRFNWFDEHPLGANEVVIKAEGSDWAVYVTDERASIVTGSVTKFTTKSDALVNFIKRLRTDYEIDGEFFSKSLLN